jgi:ABC-2 type transport system ATP-binding protein
MQPLLVCEHVAYVARSGQRLLDDVSIQVGPGEVVGLVGANGSGKTTLMRVALGLLRPRSGRVLLFGGRPDRPEALRRVGAAIDTPALYPWMSGRAALRALLGIAGEPDLGRSDRALARFGLADEGRKLVRRYSQGMRKRLALAAASLRDPDLLVLDEPTNGLDPEGRSEVHAWIRSEAEAGKAFLVATHAMYEAAQLCDRVAVMDTGRVVAAGSYEEVAGALQPPAGL